MKALLRRAELYEKTDKLDEALADYQRALERDPGLHQARAACLVRVSCLVKAMSLKRASCLVRASNVVRATYVYKIRATGLIRAWYVPPAW